MRLLKNGFKYDSPEKGFTLIEMVIIVLLMGIMSVPIGRLVVMNMRATTTSFVLSEALNYAQGSIEEVIMVGRSFGYGSITSGYNFSLQVPSHLTRTLTIVADSSNGVVFKRITVSIS
ncbi:prepilin-type N-terminal cleavage/methylation domain-containing protein, partial [bacterium]|nr:prepilin-type N-terminal cleavage/methylation domain-containing protein [candidate division CSSED10-310 bacterium]